MTLEYIREYRTYFHINANIRSSRTMLFLNSHIDNQENVELIINNQIPSSENNDIDNTNQQLSSGQITPTTSCTLLTEL